MFRAGGGVQRLGSESFDGIRVESFDLHVDGVDGLGRA
jgi:hypothetical protein